MLNFVALNLDNGRCLEADLLDSEGESFAPFIELRDHLIFMGYSSNTISAYLGHVSRFIDYVTTASTMQSACDAKTLEEIIFSYESFLLFGRDTDNEIALDVSLKINKKSRTSPASLESIEPSILLFLQLSDVAADELEQPGLFGNLFPNTIVKIKDSEKRRMRLGSMLGSVIRGGAKTKRVKGSIFRTARRTGKGTSLKKKFDFPIGKGIELLNAFKSYRDKAYYALLLAGGVRSFEAAQVLIDDVDIDNQTVEILNPFDRDATEISGITNEEYNSLFWKGREINETFLIEPYSSLFFKYLRLYLRSDEYDETVSHQFIFQKLSGEERGRPYFTADRSSVIKQFRKTCKEIGVNLPRGVARHSLRHGYAVFVLNYLPTPKGYGLPMSYVSHIMGHSSIESTKVYAKHEDEIVRADIEYANRILIGEDNPLSKKQILIGFYKSQIKALKEKEEHENNEEQSV